jgi:hypothetical protein
MIRASAPGAKKIILLMSERQSGREGESDDIKHDCVCVCTISNPTAVQRGYGQNAVLTSDRTLNQVPSRKLILPAALTCIIQRLLMRRAELT